MHQILSCSGLMVMANVATAAQLTDDFTNNADTQANWTFASPYACFSPAFTASGTASNGMLCMSSPTPASSLGAQTIAFARLNQPFDTFDVSIFAGVSFTSTELSPSARITKGVFLRGDPRQAVVFGQLGCPSSPDGGDLYYVNMDPHSGGDNRFSIIKFVGGVQTFIKSGPPYVWPANVPHNVYFGCSWDAALQTNHLVAILYMNAIQNPLIQLEVFDNSIKPDNLNPGNNGNKYAGLLVSNDSGGTVSNVCLQTPSQGFCTLGGKVVVRDSVLNFAADGDSDGIPDLCDLCPMTISGSPVDGDGCPPSIPGDFDRDGDVDGDDLLVSASCRTGSGIPVANAALCAKADFDHDQDVDQDDFGSFQRCYSGASIPGNPNCAS